MPEQDRLGASFRDPSGFMFSRRGILYRQVNHVYAGHYTRLMESGLYGRLVKAGVLIAHEEVDQALAESEAAFKVIRPQRVPFVSHPYEWSFGQLKDAALTTLVIQKRALKFDMSLKDASAYNIQFLHGRPVLIDSLSFEVYRGGPWVAYRQFCQHFLAPLALMAYGDVRLAGLLRVHIDGIPLDLAARLLPARTRLNFGLLTHIHLHAAAQKRFAGRAVRRSQRGAGMSRQAMLGLVESLEATVRALKWRPAGTEWGDYYAATNYSEAAFEHKKEVIASWLVTARPQTVWDLGANTGVFSRLASRAGIHTVSFDMDPAAVEQNYAQVKAEHDPNLLPLLMDLTNPSPASGWRSREREGLIERGPAGMIFALALIHHLAISNNVPLADLAEFFAELGEWLVIEFVPKSDSQVQRLLQSREDIFPDYTRERFEQIFGRRFHVRAAVALRASERWLYLLERR